MYEEWTTKNKMITGCLPAYNRTRLGHSRLLGVFCMDVSLILPVLEFEQKPDYLQSWAILRAQASRCFITQHTNSTLERLRADVAAESQCAYVKPDANSVIGSAGHPLAILWSLLPLALCAAMPGVGG